MLKLLFFCALVFAAIAAEPPKPYPYAREDFIINLGEPTWDHAQEEFPDGLIVYFYEPYCLPCRQFWPELKKAAATLHKDSKVTIAKVECHDEVKLCESKGVPNYPTILLYRKDKSPYEYRGPRTASDFEAWVKMVVDGEYDTVSDEANLFSRFSTALLVNRRNDNIDLAYKDLIDDVEIAKAGSDLKSKAGDAGALVTQGGLKEPLTGSAEDIVKKVNEILYVKRTAVPTFGARHSQQMQGPDNRNFVLFFRTDEFKYDSNEAKAFDRVAKERGSNDIQFAYVNVNDDILGSTMGRLFGVQSNSSVTVGVASKVGKVIKKYKLEDGQGITEASLKSLVDDIGSAEAKRYYMSAPVPTQSPKSGSILELVGSNFMETVNNKDLNVFVMFYFPWCEWCVKLEPTWKALAYRYRDVQSLKIARIDVSQNDVAGFDLTEFPVLIFYEAKEHAKPVEYLSDKTMPKFKSFLNKYIPDLDERIEL